MASANIMRTYIMAAEVCDVHEALLGDGSAGGLVQGGGDGGLLGALYLGDVEVVKDDVNAQDPLYHLDGPVGERVH